MSKDRNYYDIIVIGGGIAGCEAAKLGAMYEKKILLIERGKIGGTCLNCGCVPSKYLIKHVKNYNKKIPGKDDFSDIIDGCGKTIEMLRNGLENTLRENGIYIVYGEAEIVEDGSCTGVRVEEDFYYCKDIILATGSKPKLIDTEGIKDEIISGFVFTNESLFLNKKLPERLIVIGGGVSGVEISYVFSKLGTKVILMEVEKHILPYFDRDIECSVLGFLNRNGVIVKTGVNIKEITEGSVIYNDFDGNDMVEECDNVYLSVGRESCFQASITGVLRNNRGYFEIDDRQKTSNDHIYAIGDATGGIMLAHKGIKEAERAINSIVNRSYKRDEVVIPMIIYTHPECAQIGQSEDMLKDKGIEYHTHKISMNYSGRYVIEAGRMNAEGFLKLIFDDEHRIIGASLVSMFASEIASVLQVMIQEKKHISGLLSYTYPHPSESEIIRECVIGYHKANGLGD